VTKHSRLLHLTSQVKIERAKVADLQQELWKFRTSNEKTAEKLRSKYCTVKDNLNVMVAVKNGLQLELNTSKEKVSQLEVGLNKQIQASAHYKKKNSHLCQQIQVRYISQCLWKSRMHILTSEVW